MATVPNKQSPVTHEQIPLPGTAAVIPFARAFLNAATGRYLLATAHPGVGYTEVFFVLDETTGRYHLDTSSLGDHAAPYFPASNTVML